jgi:hypothetical protein
MGAMLLGVIASAVLYGVSLVQTFYYYIGGEGLDAEKRYVHNFVRLSQRPLVSENSG